MTSPLVGPDRDRPSASSIKATTPFQAAIGIALLVDIIRATSDFTVEPRATCEPWVKHTCLDEQDMIVSVLAVSLIQSPQYRMLFGRVCPGRHTNRAE